MISDAQICRLNIRQTWNRAVGPGGPWGQTVSIGGKSVDLGVWYEYVCALDSEHGLESCYIDMMAWRGGDAALKRTIDAENAINLFLKAIAVDVAGIANKLNVPVSAATRRAARLPAKKAPAKKTAKPVKKAARRR